MNSTKNLLILEAKLRAKLRQIQIVTFLYVEVVGRERPVSLSISWVARRDFF